MAIEENNVATHCEEDAMHEEIVKTGADVISAEDVQFFDKLLTETFTSVMRIEERVLENRLTAGLTIAEIHTLVAIGLHEVSPMKVVAARLDVSVPTLTSAINRLVKKGHVQRVRGEEDRRQVLLSLTNSGRKAVRAHNLFHRRMTFGAMEDLTPTEAEVLISALTKVRDFFEAERDAITG